MIRTRGLSIQQRMKCRWIGQLTRGFANTVCVADVAGQLDAGAATQALACLVRRHAALRTQYRKVAGQLTGTVQTAALPTFTFTDLTGLPQPGDLAGKLSLLDDWAYAHLDLDAPCLLGGKAIQFGDHALVALRTPHFVGDAVSASILFTEFAALYRSIAAGDAPGLSPLKLDHDAYVQRQERNLAEAGWAPHIDAWRALYADLAVLELPAAWRSVTERGVRGETLFALDRDDMAGFFAAARAAACPPEIAIFAVIAKIVGEWLELDEFILPTVNRGRSSIEEMGIVGLLIMDLGIPVHEARQDLRTLMLALFRRWIELGKHGGFPALIALHDVMGDRHSALETNVLVDFSTEPARADRTAGDVTRVPYAVKIENAPERTGMYLLVHGDRDGLVCQLYRSAISVGDAQAARLRAIAAQVVAELAAPALTQA